MSARPRPRRAVQRTPPAIHGSAQAADLHPRGWRATQVLDFSANLNPYGPPPVIRRAARAAALHRYPDRDGWALRRGLAQAHRVTPEQVVVGHGAAELIAAVAWAYLRAGDRALVLAPAFGEYARVSRLAGARVHELRARAETQFRHDPQQVAHALRALRPRVVWMTHPNNPTGQALDVHALAHWATEHPTTLFVVDEAYWTLAPRLPSAAPLRRPNVLILRSWTKDYALAGLRVGYALGHASIAEALRRVLPPWNLSAPAQAAGLAALTPLAQRYRAATVRAWQGHGALLQAGLRALGFHPVPGHTPFFLVPVADAAACHARLLAQGLLIRDATSFGLPRHVRISPRLPSDNVRLLAAWAQVCRRGPSETHVMRGEG